MTTAEIKSQALESIQEEMGGATTISLIKMARRLYDQGKEYDNRGDLRAALSAYVKATSLISEADRDGSVVHKEFDDIKPMHNDLSSRTKLVEDKLKATEVQTSSRREAEGGRGAGFEVRLRPLLLSSSVSCLGGPPFGSKLPPVPLVARASNGIIKTMANMTIAEIKSHALESVQREGRGAPAINLIKTARRLYDQGKEYDARSDLRAALSAYVKAARLIKGVTESTEMQAERSSGVVHKEFNDFRPTLNDLISRTKIVEEKLRAVEVQASSAGDGPIHKYGGSLADRLQALRDNDFAVNTTSKRLSLQHSSSVQLPSSSSRAGRHSQPPPLPAPSTPLSVAAPSRSPPSLHSLVSPSSFGPTSPSSTPSSSPLSSQYNLSEFTQTFPPIDKLEETWSFQIPSVPAVNNNRSSRSLKDGRDGLPPGFSVGSPHKSPSPLKSPTPLQQAMRNLMNPIERPSSTPITPIMNPFASRPESPTKTTAPLKPFYLSSPSTSPIPNGYLTYTSPLLNGSSSPAPLINGKSVSNSLFPKDLMGLPTGAKLLLIDVRDRADFQREHIKRDAVICIEPTILRRKSINATSLMKALIISPPSEVSLFANREKFDYVVLYDWNSTSFGPLDSPLSVLVQTIYEREFTRMLKHAPIILVGGLEAWKKEFGEAEVTKGDGEVVKPSPPQLQQRRSRLLIH
ncbi:hypothetical protein ARMSODRAFT_175019 [Armillaria solidipes]|uniref:Rhodanese domain-containing protein n=1 Tax=Armillaria solidipes TaxID=1076256 RepID=A0A2H3C1B5_9AGAR|nr:hypothetical protein ARMSODRAFT_175019 [Armillaria solidipes]